MPDEKILKPKSFRIDEETADRFKEIAINIGGNQQETLAKLIEAFEFQSGKAILTEKKTDIEQFEKYVNALTRMYMLSLEDNQNITETVRSTFDAQLKSKDLTIQDLQAQLNVSKQLQDDATTKSRSYADENTKLNLKIDTITKDYDSRIVTMQDMLDDKDKLNKALINSCNDLKIKVDEMQQDRENLQKLSTQYQMLKNQYDILVNQKETLEKELKNQIDNSTKTISELKQHEVDAIKQAQDKSLLEIEKSSLEIERKYQLQIQELKEQKQAEVDKYQSKYFDLLEQFKNNSFISYSDFDENKTEN